MKEDIQNFNKNYPEYFNINGKAVIYKDGNQMYFHNGEEGDIRLQKADRNLEN